MTWIVGGGQQLELEEGGRSGGRWAGGAAGTSVGAHPPRPSPRRPSRRPSRRADERRGYYAGAPRPLSTCRALAATPRRAPPRRPHRPWLVHKNARDRASHVYRNVNIYGCQFSVV